MTAPRQVLPGRTYHITRRCTQREHLLKPSRHTNLLFLYCMAAAARRIGVKLIAWNAMSNHYHAVVEDLHGRLPAFLEHFHKLLARALNAKLGRWENFWSTDPTCVVYLVDREDVFDATVYVLVNPVAANLVDRATDWPGSTSLPYTGSGRTLTVERPVGFFRKNGPTPERVTITVEAPTGEDPKEWADRVRAAVAAKERAAREERLRTGVPLVGRKSVLRMSPFSAPTTRAPRRGLRPTLACRNPARRTRELADLKSWRLRYARARAQMISGRKDVVFPAGSYRWPLLGHARCEAPPPMASGPPREATPSAATALG